MANIRTGSFIASLHWEKGMTQKELASLLGVSNKAVIKWERNESYPEITLFPTLGATAANSFHYTNMSDNPDVSEVLETL